MINEYCAAAKEPLWPKGYKIYLFCLLAKAFSCVVWERWMREVKKRL